MKSSSDQKKPSQEEKKPTMPECRPFLLYRGNNKTDQANSEKKLKGKQQSNQTQTNDQHNIQTNNHPAPEGK
jgi:hypothetical protein